MRELLQRSLDALELQEPTTGCPREHEHWERTALPVMSALRAALAQPAEPVAPTYINEDSDEECAERRSRDRAMDDARIDHLFHGFDMVILNGDEYTQGYAKAMRKEFAELVETLIACATPLDGFGGNLDSAFDWGTPHDASGAPWPDAAPAVREPHHSAFEQHLIDRIETLMDALHICREYPDFDGGGAIPDMVDAVLAGRPSKMLEQLRLIRENTTMGGITGDGK